MNSFVYFFKELKADVNTLAGGKGGVLASLYQNGYPIPNGFVIMPEAFENDQLISEAVVNIQGYLQKMRQEEGSLSFAVRSSALCEDSLTASFAGQFDTVLDVETDQEILEAIHRVRSSRHCEEVKAYSKEKGIDPSGEMAIVVQTMVPAELSGVLFTVDPITGNLSQMVGNFIFGLGDKLVSGHITPFTFTLEKSSSPRMGNYNGPVELKQHARKLYQLAIRLEKERGCPQDMEWAIACGKLYLLQSRPVTTIGGHSSATKEWNDSLSGDYLWSNVNFGEAMPQIMTPITWSIQQQIFETWKLLPGVHSCGNIGGRIYLNLSNYASVLKAFGKNKQGIVDFLEGLLYTRIPDGMEIPMIPLSRRFILSILKNLVTMQIKQKKAIREMPGFLAGNPVWCQRMHKQIRETNEKDRLLSLWKNEIFPHLQNSVWSVMGSLAQFSDDTMKLRRNLVALVGPDDADSLLSGLSSNLDINDSSGLLASLGPVLGIMKVAQGEMDRTEYMALFGHRGPNEFELSVPRPAEDSAWLDEQLAQFKNSPINVEDLLSKKRRKAMEAWNRLKNTHPQRAEKIGQQIHKLAPKTRLREAVRSEYVRDRWVARTFVLRAGELTGLGEDIFFLTIEEILSVLGGDESAIHSIPAQKETYQRYLALSDYPPMICGPFDPVRWAADPHRRNDLYDAHASIVSGTDTSREAIVDEIKGSAGSAGQIEGIVRRLEKPGEGDRLQPGEILVTSQTDISWTPLFPRAAAIVTDVGAPLSHAAIVARELGIPAVVGCGNATARLHSGDRIFVDGGKGIVKILQKN